MQIEQAVFSSVRGPQQQGYHLVGRSDGIHSELARALAMWGPSRGSLFDDDPEASSLNYHPVDSKWVAVSRTMYGGPEYSSRGELQVVTRMIVARREQLAGFDDNPLSLARAALILGHLQLVTDVAAKLDKLELPERTFIGSCTHGAYEERAPLQQVLRDIQDQRKIAVVGLDEPLPTLNEILRRIPAQRRLSVSFSTGLRPSVSRPFRLHFFPVADRALRAQMDALGVHHVSVSG